MHKFHLVFWNGKQKVLKLWRSHAPTVHTGCLTFNLPRWTWNLMGLSFLTCFWSVIGLSQQCLILYIIENINNPKTLLNFLHTSAECKCVVQHYNFNPNANNNVVLQILSLGRSIYSEKGHSITWESCNYMFIIIIIV